MTAIDKPGLYHDVPEATYHADPCPEPSLSHSVAVALLDQSPAHARAMHPRLGGESEWDPSSAADIGKAIHAGLTRTSAAIVVVDAKDWRTNDAKDQRAAAHAAGKVPLLKHQQEAVWDATLNARMQIQKHEIAPDWKAGRGEVTVVWRETINGFSFWCRARIDWLPDGDAPAFYDVKTTTGSADPDMWSRRLFDGGYDVQAAFYRRGLRAVGFKRMREARFVVLEQAAPHALSVVALDPQAVHMADEKVERAMELWAACLKRETWPGYPARICYAEAKPWEITKHAERQERARERRELKGDIAAELMHWQAPARTKGEAA
ncbi:MAG: PD-(D/E)XK nuclease-like domain-containing protein [Proteobacteria bacterium]|nr:PD-(D/E)XK nuclease-like domain-containing protein [Pseudomonadota bacterium]